MINRRKMLMMDSLQEYTVIGNPASFNTNVSKPLKQLLIPFYPVQEGSGDPSPSNIRPITGWTGLNVTRTGRNLIDQTAGRTSASNWWYGSIRPNDEPDGSLVLNAGTYTLSTSESQSGLYVRKNGVNIAVTYNNTKLTFSLTERTAIKILLYKAGATIDYWNTITIQLEIGSTKTPYEEYNGTTIPVSFSNVYYGGALNLTTGVLTIDTRYIASYNGETLPGVWISDRDVYSPGISPSIGAEVAYELAEPITFQLTSQQIITLIGDNVIFTDTNGNNTIKYYKEG